LVLFRRAEPHFDSTNPDIRVTVRPAPGQGYIAFR
jgi:hypothetical protein